MGRLHSITGMGHSDFLACDDDHGLKGHWLAKADSAQCGILHPAALALRFPSMSLESPGYTRFLDVGTMRAMMKAEVFATALVVSNGIKAQHCL